VALPEQEQPRAAGYGLHPALLDAAMHASLLAHRDQGGNTVLPFAWGGICLHGAGAVALRVRISAAGPDRVSVLAADEAGVPVLSVESLASRPVGAGQLAAAGGAGGAGSLLEVAWQPAAPAPAGGGGDVVPGWWGAGAAGAAGAAGGAGGAGGVVPPVVAYECPGTAHLAVHSTRTALWHRSASGYHCGPATAAPPARAGPRRSGVPPQSHADNRGRCSPPGL
jgi:hypothetical protein